MVKKNKKHIIFVPYSIPMVQDNWYGMVWDGICVLKSDSIRKKIERETSWTAMEMIEILVKAQTFNCVSGWRFFLMTLSSVRKREQLFHHNPRKANWTYILTYTLQNHHGLIWGANIKWTQQNVQKKHDKALVQTFNCVSGWRFFLMTLSSVRKREQLFHHNQLCKEQWPVSSYL